MACIKLWELAHAKSGDKGNTLNISLIPSKTLVFLIFLAIVAPVPVVHGGESFI